MTLLRRLALGMVTLALLVATAYAAGAAVRRTSGTPSLGSQPLRWSSSEPIGRSSTDPMGWSSSERQRASSRPPQPATPPKPPTPIVDLLKPGPTLLGPGASGPNVRDLQARLAQIAWYFGDVSGRYDDSTTEAVRGFQAKREIAVTGAVDRRTLERLRAMTSAPTHQALFNLGNVPGALDARCRTGRVLCVDKSSQTLRWVVDGTVLKTVDVRFGASYSPTREGVFHVYDKDRDHVSLLYGSAMPFAMFFSGGQAVHYSSDFAARGYAGASHGCINVRDYDAVAWLYDHVRVGDEVVVYWS